MERLLVRFWDAKLFLVNGVLRFELDVVLKVIGSSQVFFISAKDIVISEEELMVFTEF